MGPGVGDHASPDSSSRMNHASAVGSITGSFANVVRRFSRLFSDRKVALLHGRLKSEEKDAVIGFHVKM
jgi:RecG-like helicase